MRKGDGEVSKFKSKALEGQFVGSTEYDNRYQVSIPNSRKVMRVRDKIFKESDMGSIGDNNDTTDQLGERSEQLEIWHRDDVNQDNGNKERHGMSTAAEDELQNVERANA